MIETLQTVGWVFCVAWFVFAIALIVLFFADEYRNARREADRRTARRMAAEARAAAAEQWPVWQDRRGVGS